MVAYGHDLLQRIRGAVAGPAVLSLWRQFATTKDGSPKPGFRLCAATILEEEQKLVEMVKKKKGRIR